MDFHALLQKMITYFVLNLSYIYAIVRKDRKHKISGKKQRVLSMCDICVTCPILFNLFAKEKHICAIDVLV